MTDSKTLHDSPAAKRMMCFFTPVILETKGYSSMAFFVMLTKYIKLDVLNLGCSLYNTAQLTWQSVMTRPYSDITYSVSVPVFQYAY